MNVKVKIPTPTLARMGLVSACLTCLGRGSCACDICGQMVRISVLVGIPDKYVEKTVHDSDSDKGKSG